MKLCEIAITQKTQSKTQKAQSPESYRNRETLWNSVELCETAFTQKTQSKTQKAQNPESYRNRETL